MLVAAWKIDIVGDAAAVHCTSAETKTLEVGESDYTPGRPGEQCRRDVATAQLHSAVSLRSWPSYRKYLLFISS